MENEKHFNQIAVVLVVLFGLIAYGPVLKLPFFWDDHQIIEQNRFITSWSMENLKHNFTSDVSNQGSNYYRPLQTISNTIDFSLWRLRPFGYHLTNLVIHLINAILIYFLIALFLVDQKIGLFSALIFVVHPIIVQELMIIAGRAELLASLFILITILLFLKEGKFFYFLSLITFSLGLLSKESGIIVLVVLAFLVKQRKKIPRLFPFVFLAILYLFLRSHYVGQPFPKIGPTNVIKFVLWEFPKILFIYVRLLIFPIGLHSHRNLPDYGPECGLFLLIILTLFFLLIKRKSIVGIFSFLWFILFLLPKSPVLISSSFMLDHWVYLSAPGLFIPLILLFQKSQETRRPAWIFLGRVAFFGFLIWMIALVRYNILVRRNDFFNYQRSLKYSNSSRVIYNMGRVYYINGDYAQALTFFQKAIERHPEDRMYRNSLAVSYYKTGTPHKAIEILNRLVKSNPEDELSLINLSVIYIQGKRYDLALDLLEKILKIKPKSEQAYYYMAGLYRRREKWSKAIEFYRRALDINPYHLAARNDLGALYAQMGNYDAARQQWEFVINAKPDSVQTKMNLERLKNIDYNK